MCYESSGLLGYLFVPYAVLIFLPRFNRTGNGCVKVYALYISTNIKLHDILKANHMQKCRRFETFVINTKAHISDKLYAQFTGKILQSIFMTLYPSLMLHPFYI